MLTSPMDAPLCSGASTPATMAHRCRRGASTPSVTPVPVDLPEDLPALYRAYVEDLVATLSDETVVGRAAEELRDLIKAVVIHWDAATASHRVEIEGKLLGLLQKANPACEAGYVCAEGSQKLVAARGVSETLCI